METKHCTRCDNTKDASAFSRDKAQKDGLCARCRDCRSEYGRSWYERLGKAARNCDEWRSRKAVGQGSYYRRNKAKFRESGRRWIEANKEKVRACQRETMRQRRSVAKGKLENNVSCALHRALKGRKNGEPSFRLLGFGVEQLMAHMERQFTKGMSWDNYGKWHVDHIRPLVSFEYSEPTDPEFRSAWALTNLRPLWASENISKGGRVSLLI
jgi:hypothetical protein